MSNFKFLFLLISVFYILVSCKTNKVSGTSKTTETEVYTEDLSENIKIFKNENPPVSATKSEVVLQETDLTITQKVNEQIQADNLLHQNAKYMMAYKIQLYMGRDRNIAQGAKQFSYSNYPNLEVFESYKIPFYNVKVGPFKSKIEAEKALKIISNSYTDAIILQEKIENAQK